MPILKNIATDLTPEQLMDQVNRHPETRKQLDEILRIQQVFTGKLQQVCELLEIGEISNEMPLKSLKKPHHLTKKPSEDETSEVTYQWHNEENQPIEAEFQELEFLQLIDQLLLLQERVLREQSNRAEIQASEAEKASEKLQNICKKFQKNGLQILEPKELEWENFSLALQDQAQSVNKLSRKEWKERLETLWKNLEKEITTSLSILKTASQDTVGKEFPNLEETVVLKNLLTSLHSQNKEDFQSATKEGEKIVQSTCENYGIQLPTSHSIVEFQRIIQETVLVIFPQKKQLKDPETIPDHIPVKDSKKTLIPRKKTLFGMLSAALLVSLATTLDNSKNIGTHPKFKGAEKGTISYIGTETPLWLSSGLLSGDDLWSDMLNHMKIFTGGVQEKHLRKGGPSGISIIDPKDEKAGKDQLSGREISRNHMRLYEIEIHEPEAVELASKVYEFVVINRHYIIFRVEIKGSKTTAWYAIEQDKEQIKQHFMLTQDKPGTMSICNAIDSKLIRKTEFHGDYYNAEEALPHILAIISIQELKGY